MGIDCGSQVCICDLPIHIDTYSGCSHACKYCFVKRKHGIAIVKPLNCVKNLENFIAGKRAQTCSWCDWNIPLHWGAMSDPFQPAEKRFGVSLKCLEVFKRTQYPFVVSTKGRLIVEEPYISILSKCNCVLQISAASKMYDKIEDGAPSFDERVQMCRKISPLVKRVVIRVQPYIREALNDIIKNLTILKDAGAYGVVVEGMKYIIKRPETVKVGGDWCYKESVLRSDFNKIKEECKRIGLHFFCGENRLRSLGEDACCCGIVGLEGFIPNRFNSYHLIKGDAPRPTDSQRGGASNCFKAMHQDRLSSKYLKNLTFEECMINETKNIIKKGTLG